MASKQYSMTTVTDQRLLVTRTAKQGRKPAGLDKPKLYRLTEQTRRELDELKVMFGYLYNENEIVREAVARHVHTIYTELLKQ